MDLTKRIDIFSTAVDAIDLAWKILSGIITLGGIIISSSAGPKITIVSTYVTITCLGIMIGMIPQLYRYLTSEDENLANNSLYIEHADINTEIERITRTHTRKITVRALDKTDHAIHHSRSSAPVDISYSVPQGGTLKGPIQIAGASKMIVEFDKELERDDTHTYILQYELRDENENLKPFQSQRFSDFSGCDSIKWEIQFKKIPNTIERYVWDRETESMIKSREKIALNKNNKKDIWEPTNANTESEYVYEWRW